MSFTDTDLGADALQRMLKGTGRATVRVGILSDSPHQDENGASGALSVAEIAAVHEFGAEIAAVHEFGAPAVNVPQRSFIRATVDAEAAEIQRLQETLFAQVIDGGITESQALELVGAKVAAMMQARITSNVPPPLKPETVERKGSSVALVDSGQLKSSIVWEVGS